MKRLSVALAFMLGALVLAVPAHASSGACSFSPDPVSYTASGTITVSGAPAGIEIHTAITYSGGQTWGAYMFTDSSGASSASVPAVNQPSAIGTATVKVVVNSNVAPKMSGKNVAACSFSVT